MISLPVFVVMIFFSLMLYIYYKVRYIRSSNQTEKRWLTAKSSIALGSFVSLFGLNRLFLTFSTTAFIISIIFIVIGLISIWTGFKAYKFYLPYMNKENENIR